MKSEPVPRVPRRRRPMKKRQRNSDTESTGRRPGKPASYNQSSRPYHERALKQRTLLTDRTHERTVSHINAEKSRFSRTMNRQETDLLNRLMELEACLPKYHQSDTGTADIGKADKLDKTRKKLQQHELKVPTASNCELSPSEEFSDKPKTSSLQPKISDNPKMLSLQTNISDKLNTSSLHTTNSDKPKTTLSLQPESSEKPKTSPLHAQPKNSDKLKTSSLQPKNSSPQQNDIDDELPSAPPESDNLKDVQKSSEPNRLSPVLEASEAGSTTSGTPGLPSIPSNTTSAKCVVCEGNVNQPDTEHRETTRNGATNEGVRLPQIDQLSEEERAEARLNPGLPRSLLQARIRKRSVSKLQTSNPNKYRTHFPNTCTEAKTLEGSSKTREFEGEKYPLERNVHHLPPIRTDRDYGRRTWPGDAMELVGMNGYTSDIMPKVMQASYSYNTRIHQHQNDKQEITGDSLPTVVRSRALIRREQKKPSKDMYVWLGLDSKYQLRLMTNPAKSVSHTDKS
ncbi:uncharacterized protein LOC144871982 [Branchiostoma floridae x Branchiostoma japonicum]